ncbi:MAG TPA: choice-of-anchor tandem repeat GloVer-containing protein, partial [Candidatus Baltobacteraceae bacterium]|nr:choice-of-anchor tandem repeat GloVer-containing protein [Candidatus Baltobacteraceae bacterium]
MRTIFALLSGMALVSCSGGARSLPVAPALPTDQMALIQPSDSYKLLFSFNASDGQEPIGGLAAVKGTLYGATRNGGEHGDGAFFKITTRGKQTVLYSFKAGSDGFTSVTPPTFMNGVLYGTTPYGGTSQSNGTVFRMTTRGKETVLYRFNGSPDGGVPQAPLIGVGGVLYGTTCSGGTSNHGTVFQITPSGAEKVIYSFQGSPKDGQCPEAALTDVKGKFYGTASSGGSKSNGIVFAVTTS